MIKLVVVGKIREIFVRDGLTLYLERLARFTRISLTEVKDSGIEEEGERIIKVLGDDYTVALDVKGKSLSSEEFSAFLKKSMEKNVSFVIGGPDGLSDTVKERADYALSLSNMTLTHEMARLLLAEQIYRAYTIMKGIKYHK